ncbi:3825_t:CDS:2 [Acaulospora colombiana]|uniref:3825_t:CDS:1 n=1 Tax=Acaulospora colombiana TaxID=27376 RepID=A0ACA9KUR4_9GLOM|nr:3825_t:CDS:2 [Acaulospora colombiana]
MGKSLSKEPTHLRYKELFPINDEEIERQHLRHHVVREIFGGNFSSPVHDILETGWAKVLDVDCGPGTWLFELSSDYPGCTYIGTNPSYVISLLNNAGKPFDVEFVDANLITDDIGSANEQQESGLPFVDNCFDFVSLRYSSYDYTSSEWENIILKELVRVLKPGGWLELMDFELMMSGSGPILSQFIEKKLGLLESFNIELDLLQKLQNFLETSGDFTNVQCESKRFPIGKFAGKLGESVRTLYYETYKSIIPQFAKHLGIREKEISSTIDTMMDEIDVNEVYSSASRIFGQKRSERTDDEIDEVN